MSGFVDRQVAKERWMDKEPDGRLKRDGQLIRQTYGLVKLMGGLVEKWVVEYTEGWQSDKETEMGINKRDWKLCQQRDG